MMISLTKVIHRGATNGPIYTQPGENHTVIQKKAHAFTVMYPLFVAAKNVDGIVKPDNVDQDIYEQLMKELFRNTQVLRWMVKMIEKKLNPLWCTEDAVREFLQESFDEQTTMKEKGTFQKNISQVRSAFRAIGREHAWGAGKSFDNLGAPLVDSSNPMTTATEKALITAFKERNNPDKMRHEGFPASIALFYVVTIIHMQTVMVEFMGTVVKQTGRMVNMCNLVFLNVLMMHEAGRPGDSHRHMVHQDIELPLHRKVYALTLVFLRTETLTHLIESKAITHYVVGMYKGKPNPKKDAFMVRRMKTIIPPDFNSLDLVLQYVLMTKMSLSLQPDLLQKTKDGWLVFKQKVNYSSLNARKNKGLGLKGFVSYSARYAAAAEDKTARIDESWTRARMGHTRTSNTKDLYADIREDRAIYVDPETEVETPMPLGTDKYLLPGTLSLEFNRILGGVIYKDDWLDKAFDKGQEDMRAMRAMRAEFEEVADLVDKMLDADDVEAHKTLLGILAEQGRDWLHKIPMGFKVKPGAGLIPPPLLAKFEEAVEKCVENEWLAAPAGQGQQTVELSFFAQTLYGRWGASSAAAAAAAATAAPAASLATPNKVVRKILSNPPAFDFGVSSGVVARVREMERQQQEEIEAETQEEEAQAQAQTVNEKKRAWFSSPTTAAYFKKTKRKGAKAKQLPTKLPDATPKLDLTPSIQLTGWEADPQLEDIKRGDRVVVVCTMSDDKCALRVREEDDVWAWICDVTQPPRPKAASAFMRGNFYFNATQDIHLGLERNSKTETIKVQQTSIIRILPKTKEETSFTSVSPKDLKYIHQFFDQVNVQK
jgi:hypothetical protein